ncbi:MAG: TIGR00341 family protein [Deltaproteobacteria bacterium]|nr:TIGR00341 family protein [Deltaproteobacteria bacterium]MBW2071890.1 TIGR00341 family protein [Deltaproteobacteria bacterium]
MALRMIELVVPADIGAYVDTYLNGQPVLGVWRQPLADEQTLVKVLLAAEDAEAILDLFERNYGSLEAFRAVLIPVEASLPRMETVEDNEDGTAPATAATDKKSKKRRISREELYVDITDAAKLSPVFAAMVVLSAIVASIGIMRDNTAVVIGAMVIAPLLGPNAALSLATTLGEMRLARTALKTSFVGVAITLVLSAAIGLVAAVDPAIQEIASRTQVGLSDIVLALAAGGAGALAFTSGVSSTLVGVMVAVAFLPPLVVFGLLCGSGFFSLAFEALLLFAANLICINLAGVLVFLLQGVQPRLWWEAEMARRATQRAVIIWFALLLALVAVILLGRGR